MPFKEVNLTGGLNLQDSDSKIGFNEFKQLQNLRHEGGHLVKRYGTGDMATISSANIDNMAIYVHRKLSGAVISSVGGNNLTFTNNNQLDLAGTTGLSIPGQTADFRNIFKAGDTIIISTSATVGSSGTPANKDKPLVISSVPTATRIIFETTVTNEIIDNNDSGSVSAQITFVLGVSGSSSPTNITIVDSNSFDGRAFLTTFTDTNKELALINPLDYSDKIDLIDFGTGSGDMHIRPVAYTDAVRIACGLEHDPRIFRYVNRHHFNGLLKSTYNSNADLLYPRWIIDKAIPTATAGTYTLSTFKADDVGGTADSVRFINGSLNLKDNTYDYKFIPVYDGNQEGLLGEQISQASTGTVSTIHDKENNRSVVDASKSCALATITIDMQKLNPRTSGINVYRSTNGGTYYKIKSIYMGDNDQNQHSIADIYNENDRVWFSGSTTLASTTLNGKKVVHDGFTKDIVSSSGNNDFQSTGYKSFETSTISDAIGLGTYTRVEYGDDRTCKFNSISEETEVIVGGDDSYTGGSPNGGWYIGGTNKTLIANNTTDLSYNDEPGTEPDGDIHDNCSGYHSNNPFGDSASGYLDFYITNPGDEKNDAGACFDISDESSSLTNGTYIISGWIRAVGLNHRDSRWNFYVTSNKDQGDNADSGGSGIRRIASGQGVNNANMPWTYFQYQLDITSGDDLFGVVFINTPDGLTSSTSDAGPGMCVQVWGLRLTETVSGYDLNQRLRGFMGSNVMVSSSIDDEQFPPGSLKGNRIQDDSTVAYPVDVDADRSYISDNYGPFIKCVDSVPGVSSTDNNKDNFMFGSSNYQFYFDGSDNTVQNMKLDFLDPGLPDGARHPNETATSTDVKFKYATILNGRQFVGNVKITGEDGTEEYPNFIMFSEPNSPDVIPTTNYIQLQDLQGGEIVGIESIMGGIVVFMTNGIFRLNVPSSNPTNWSLVESHPNIGCLHDKAICKVPNGIFVATREDIVFLDSGFSASPITQKVRDVYQARVATAPEMIRLQHDVKYNRLRVLFDNSSGFTRFLLYDISRGVWTDEKHSVYIYDEMAVDEKNNFSYIASDTNSVIKVGEDTTKNVDEAGVSDHQIPIVMETGQEQLSAYDTNVNIRRVYTDVSDATDSPLDLTVTGTSTASISKHYNDELFGQEFHRPSIRGHRFGVKIDTDPLDASNQNPKINKIELEYE